MLDVATVVAQSTPDLDGVALQTFEGFQLASSVVALAFVGSCPWVTIMDEKMRVLDVLRPAADVECQI